METLKYITINIVLVFIAVYILGFIYCMSVIAGGGDGSDIMSQHYRSVIIKIIK